MAKLKIHTLMLRAGFWSHGEGKGWHRPTAEGGRVVVCYGDGQLHGDPDSDGWSARRFDASGKEIRGACGMTMAEAIEAEPVTCES